MRNSDGTFAKGNGGRKKGSKNKTTAEIRELIHDLVCANIDTIQSDLDKLEPYERLRILTQLITHVLPKAKPIDATINYDVPALTLVPYSKANVEKPIKWTDEP